MSDAHVTVNGRPVTKLELTVPAVGLWFADVEFTDDAPGLTGAVEIAIGNTKLRGTVRTGGTFGLQRRCRIVAGADGWGAMLSPKPYHNDAGVKARTVADDAAREAGETLGSFAGGAERLGLDYVRDAGPASRTLELAARGADWWVDYAGITHVGARVTATAAAGSYEVLNFDPRAREAEIALDEIAAVGIGSVLTERLDEPVTVRSLCVTVTPDSIRMRAWCGPGRTSSLADSMRAIVQRLTDGKLYGKYRYRVVSMNVDRVNLQAVRKAAGLPDLPSPISMWPGVAGAHAELTPGAEVLVEFIEGDREAPIITGFVGRGGPGHQPVTLSLGGGSAPVARVGGSVAVYFPPAVPVAGTLSGAPFFGTITITSPGVGVIQDGNPKVLV